MQPITQFWQYDRLAKLTHPTNGCDPIEHGFAGMISEVGEIAEAYLEGEVTSLNMLEEAGDVLWYLARFTGGLGTDLKYVAGHGDFRSYEEYVRKTTAPTKESPDRTALLVLVAQLGALGDARKRLIAYGKPLHLVGLGNNASNILRGLTRFLHAHGYTLSQAAQANIAKLATRNEALRAHPALRDKAAENEVMAKAAGVAAAA